MAMGSRDIDAAVHEAVRAAARRGHRATVSEVASQVGAARSSVYRVAQKLGYKSWIEFTSSLVRYHAGEQGGDPVATSVKAVADALLRNRHLPILVDAVGDAEVCSMYLLLRLGECDFFPMPFTKHIAQARGGTAGSGVVIVINESGMSLLRTCLAAREQGFEVVSITSSHDTPVSKMSSINVVIKNNKSHIDSYEPNHFAAGALAFLERVLYRMGREAPFA